MTSTVLCSLGRHRRSMAWRIATWSIALVVYAIARPEARAIGGAASSCAGPDEVLPAGRYFAGFERGIGAKLHCPRPAVAVVAGIFDDAASAEALTRSISSSTLAPGYPWVVHTGYLGVKAPAPGLAIVVGLFASRRRAEAWTARIRWSAPVEVLEVLDERGANRAFADTAGGAIHVVQMDGDERVAAYRAEDVRTVSRGLSPVDPFDDHLASRLGRITPRCMLDPHALFAASERELDIAEVPFRAFAPVQCGGERLWVPWISTRLESVVFPDGPRYRLAQVTSVECNSPSIDVWTYEGHGRRPPRSRHIRRQSCGP